MSDKTGLTEEQLARVLARGIRMYAEMHPRPTQVTQTQAAEILGVAPRTVRRYIRAGRLKLNGYGYLSIVDLDALLDTQ